MKRSAILAISALALASSTVAASGNRSAVGIRPPVVGSIIYKVSGVFDEGLPGLQGMATAFNCTNFSASAATVEFIVKNYDGSLVEDFAANVVAGHTFTYSTKSVASLDVDHVGPGGAIHQGSAIIRSTVTNIHCSAMIIDATSDPMHGGVDLHMVRFNAISGSQE